MKEHGVIEDDFKAVEARIRASAAEAADFEQRTSEPDPSELWTDITL